MKQFYRSTSGAGAVEFALVSPLLIAILMAIIEFSMIFYTYASAELITADVNRQVATNHIVGSQFQSKVTPRLPAWVQEKGTATAATTPTTESGVVFWTATTTIPLLSAAPTSFFSALYGSRTMTVVNVMRQEPRP